MKGKYTIPLPQTLAYTQSLAPEISVGSCKDCSRPSCALISFRAFINSFVIIAPGLCIGFEISKSMHHGFCTVYSKIRS